MASNTAKVSLKLPVDAQGQSPEGSVCRIVRLLSKQGMMGSIGNLYESIENLNDTYMQGPEAKDALLKPHVFAPAVPLLLPVTQTSIPTSYYRCSSYCWNNVAKEPTANSPQCGHLMNAKLLPVKPPNKQSPSWREVGFVKGVVTYSVMDNLEVKPMSTISSISILNEFNIKEVSSLEERVVDVGMDQRLKLLKASLQSKTALTHEFLGK
ncbi:hypothetical protein SLE2022_069800 [Rubroshorea leprosula]